jgi:glucosyl-3-phosphoglycerate phosphatase
VTRLVLWRHGQTQANVSAIIQGTLDSELSEQGRAQAEASAPVLAALRPELIVSSDLRRAADTAAALSALTRVPVSYDERLRERSYGEWQGLNATQIAERWPDEYARWRAGKPVGGAGVEEADEIAKRVVPALQEVAAAAAGRTAVVVTHASAAGHGTGALLGWPATVVRTLVNLANCHWTELRLDAVRGWQLVAHNVGYAAVAEPSGTR